jgi:hypothetical protein
MENLIFIDLDSLTYIMRGEMGVAAKKLQRKKRGANGSQ